MKLFGKEPQEQAMQTFIHDSKNHTQQLKWRLSHISDWLTKNTKAIDAIGVNTSAIHVSVEYLKTEIKNLTEDIDAYYVKFTKDFKEDEL